MAPGYAPEWQLLQFVAIEKFACTRAPVQLVVPALWQPSQLASEGISIPTGDRPMADFGEAVGSDEFGFILAQGSDLLGPVNAALASMYADGTIDALNRMWLF